MLSNLLKNLSILKKFLFINLIFFTIIGLFTFIYLEKVQPNLIKKKSSNHIEIINNTIDNLNRLKETEFPLRSDFYNKLNDEEPNPVNKASKFILFSSTMVTSVIVASSR